MLNLIQWYFVLDLQYIFRGCEYNEQTGNNMLMKAIRKNIVVFYGIQTQQKKTKFQIIWKCYLYMKIIILQYIYSLLKILTCIFWAKWQMLPRNIKIKVNGQVIIIMCFSFSDRYFSLIFSFIGAIHAITEWWSWEDNECIIIMFKSYWQQETHQTIFVLSPWQSSFSHF